MSRRSWTGQIVGGRYRIDEILGQGGMSAVYKAFDPNLKRVVAIKMIHPHLAGDPKFIIRFEEEATAVAQLRHPNIVQVFDFTHDEDQYYMVQEFVPGETLQDRLRRLNRVGRRLSLDEVIRFSMDICEAAGYAHRLGMVHRDIKPANIMLGVNGQAILMDFGIVKITGGQQHTVTGAVVGTAIYLPPEVIRGEIADPRSDIYSLGVTLFEMVSGRPPFEADSAMTLMMMHLNDPVPDLRLLRPEVPVELMAVIEKALAKDREARYRSMAEMAAALRKVREAHPAVAPESATLLDEAEESRPEKASPEEIPLSPEIAAAPRPPLQPATPEPPVVSAPNILLGASSPTGSDLAQASPADAAGPAAPSNVQFQPVKGWSHAQPIPPGQGQAQVFDSQTSRPAPAGKKLKLHPAVWIGIPLVFLTFVLCGSIYVWQNFGVARIPETSVVNPPTTEAAAPAAALDTPAPAAATPTPPATREATATATLTEAPTPLPTLPPGLFPTVEVPTGLSFAQINGIELNENDQYVVSYETFEYVESDHDMHVHFFFNTVPPEEAGLPEQGPWFVYGGPRPFSGYQTSDRPVNAAGMCILVANADHSVQPESGNCMLLPDVVAAAPLLDSSCYAGPSPDYIPVTSLTSGQVLLVRGISPDENWWNVAHPEDAALDCWLPKATSAVRGDISLLPLVEPPPPPSAPAFSVEITRITIDAQNRYVVAYQTRGFTESLPGTHMHFFFNNVPEDQVGIEGTGQRLMHGGPTPFTGYRTTDRPADATELCVLVANPDHSVISGSGNCLGLPDAP